MDLKKYALSAVLLVFVILACQAPQADSPLMKVEYLTSEMTANLPFSDAVRVGNVLILSGQIGNIPGEMSVVPGGMKAEAKQVMENIKSVLERYGSSMDRVIKCTVMLDNISEWADFNTVYITYFPDHKPARSAFAASGLAMGAKVEVECWAMVE